MSARNSEQCSQPVIVAELFCLFDRFILLCGAENSLPERSIQVNHATLLSRMIDGIWGEEVVPMPNNHVGFAGHSGMDSMLTRRWQNTASDAIAGGYGCDSSGLDISCSR